MEFVWRTNQHILLLNGLQKIARPQLVLNLCCQLKQARIAHQRITTSLPHSRRFRTNNAPPLIKLPINSFPVTALQRFNRRRINRSHVAIHRSLKINDTILRSLISQQRNHVRRISSLLQPLGNSQLCSNSTLQLFRPLKLLLSRKQLLVNRSLTIISFPPQQRMPLLKSGLLLTAQPSTPIGSLLLHLQRRNGLLGFLDLTNSNSNLRHSPLLHRNKLVRNHPAVTVSAIKLLADDFKVIPQLFNLVTRLPQHVISRLL